jgi:hypothetical protein
LEISHEFGLALGCGGAARGGHFDDGRKANDLELPGPALAALARKQGGLSPEFQILGGR